MNKTSAMLKNIANSGSVIPEYLKKDAQDRKKRLENKKPISKKPIAKAEVMGKAEASNMPSDLSAEIRQLFVISYNLYNLVSKTISNKTTAVTPAPKSSGLGIVDYMTFLLAAIIGSSIAGICLHIFLK